MGALGKYAQDSLCELGSFQKNGSSYVGRHVSNVDQPSLVSLATDPADATKKAIKCSYASSTAVALRFNVQSGYEGDIFFVELEVYVDKSTYVSYRRICQMLVGATNVRIELDSHTSNTKPKVGIRIGGSRYDTGTNLDTQHFPLQSWHRIRVEWTNATNPGTTTDGTVTVKAMVSGSWVDLFTVGSGTGGPTHTLGSLTRIELLAAGVSSGVGIDFDNYFRNMVVLTDALADHGLATGDATWWRDYAHRLGAFWQESNKIKLRVGIAYKAGTLGYDGADKPVWGVQIATDAGFSNVVYDGYANDPQTIDAANDYWAWQTTGQLEPETTYYIRGKYKVNTSASAVTGWETSFQTPSTASSGGLETLRVIYGHCRGSEPAAGLAALREYVEAGNQCHLFYFYEDIEYCDNDSIWAQDAVTTTQWGGLADMGLCTSDTEYLAARMPTAFWTGDHPAGPFTPVGWSGGGGFAGIISDEAGDVLVGNTVNFIDFYNSVWTPRVFNGYPDQSVGGARGTAAALFPSRTRADGSTAITDAEVNFYRMRTRQCDFVALDVRRWQDYEQGAEGASGEMPHLGAEQLAWLESIGAETTTNLKILLSGLVVTPNFLNSYELVATPSAAFTVGETVSQASSGATGTVLYSGAGSIVVGKESGTFVTNQLVTGGTSGSTITPTSLNESNKVGAAEGWGRTTGNNALYSDYAGDPRVYGQELAAIGDCLHANAKGIIISADHHFHYALADLWDGDSRWLFETGATLKSVSHGLPGDYDDFAALAADLAPDGATVSFISNNNGAAQATGYGVLEINEQTGNVSAKIHQVTESAWSDDVRHTESGTFTLASSGGSSGGSGSVRPTTTRKLVTGVL